jgi:hypothetical protein
MNRNEIDFCEQMEIGKQVAMDRRNKGLPVGKPAAGWTRKQSDYAPASDNDKFCYLVKAGWRVESGSILEDFRRYLYPERYEPIDL